MKNLPKHFRSLAVASILAIPAVGAQASLEYLGTQQFQGTGLGAVNTILTIQSPGNSTFESGSVGLNSSGVEVISGDAKTGASQTQVRSISSLGLSQASDLRIVFNAVEPGNTSANSINLDDLVLNIYSPGGSLLFTSGSFAAQSFANTFTGTGQAGFVFGLDTTQAAQAQAQAFSGGSFGNNLIGLSATASMATGGPETFFVTAVPEPETYLMMLSGLGLLGFIARRRARKTA